MKTQFKNGLTGNWLVLENNQLSIHPEKLPDVEEIDNPLSSREPTESSKQHLKSEQIMVANFNQNNK